jgi:multidrug resistance protein MdtO
MSSQDQALPAAIGRSRTPDAAAWFWHFLKTELAPYPGRAWVVTRITIAATITMVLVMTFRVPFGYLGAIATFFMSRENPAVTLRNFIAVAILSAFCALYTIVGIMMLVDDPLTHFLWIATSVFLAFYLIRVISNYGLAIGFGGILGGIIPLWDETQLTVNARTENTLWVLGSLIMGAAVTVAVEYLFHRVHPIPDLILAIQSRMQAVEDVLRQIAADHPVSGKVEREISQYSALGTSRTRRQLLHSGYTQQFIVQMNVAVALLGRLVDLAASLRILRSTQSIASRQEDRDRCLRLTNQVSNLRHDLMQRHLPHAIDTVSHPGPSDLPLLPEMEQTVALIRQAFSATTSTEEWFVAAPLDAEVRSRLFVADALSNVDHLKFAVRGTVAAMFAYVVYQAIDWPGLSTAVVTCILTALSTIGSSRQKQFLRLGGAIIGGFIFGMGAQIFVLPYLDSITGFTVLFAIVTAISAWIATATPRLSYLGLQVAFAFFLIHLQEFAPQTSLSIARDRVVGVLLGLTSMWLIFDHLWVKDALQEMQEGFARNLRRVAELIELARKPPSEEVARRALRLRDQINAGFNEVEAQCDAVVFEFGPSRQRKLKIRDDIRRWQPALGALPQVQITGLEYLFERRSQKLAQGIAEALAAFEEDMAITAQLMSEEVSGKPCRIAPDLQESAARLRQEVEKHYVASGLPIPPALADMISLTQNLASIVVPLSADIHATFTNLQHAVMHHPRTKLSEA